MVPAIILYKHYSYQLETHAKDVFKKEAQNEHTFTGNTETYLIGIRMLALVMAAAAAAFFAMRPSRTVREILVHKVS